MKTFNDFLNGSADAVLEALETPVHGVPSATINNREYAHLFIRFSIEEILRLAFTTPKEVAEALKNG